MGTNATWKALELAREAESLGADALLVLAPYYNKPTQEGLFQHFRAVARGTTLPVVVYNIPGRAAVNILPKTLVRIAQACPNVVAVKEASGSLDQASEIIAPPMTQASLPPLARRAATRRAMSAPTRVTFGGASSS